MLIFQPQSLFCLFFLRKFWKHFQFVFFDCYRGYCNRKKSRIKRNIRQCFTASSSPYVCGSSVAKQIQKEKTNILFLIKAVGRKKCFWYFTCCMAYSLAYLPCLNFYSFSVYFWNSFKYFSKLRIDRNKQRIMVWKSDYARLVELCFPALNQCWDC